ncbi:MAG: hypothetical protein ACLQMF_11325 [Rectinemataceae bacterium]
MKPTRYVSTALIGLVAVLFAASCNNSFGAFSNIQKAQPQNTSSDFKGVSVVNFAQTSNYYYAVPAAVYERPIGGGSWTSLSLPNIGVNYSCTGIAGNGTTDIYIAATSNTDSASNIYHSGDGGNTWTVLGTNGMTLTVNAGQNRYDQVDGIWYANGILYAQLQYFATSGVTQNPNVGYSLYFWNGSAFSMVSGAPSATAPNVGNTAPFMSVAEFNTSYNYCACGSTIYSSTTPYTSFSSSFTGDGSTVFGMKARFTGTGANTPALLAWTSNNNIYATTNGTTFTSVGPPNLSTDNFISDVQELPISGGYELIVGTGTNNVSYTANGYWEGIESGTTVSSWAGGDSGQVAPNGNNSTYDALFAAKPVIKFFYDSLNSRLFAGISASGYGTLASSTGYGLVSTYNTSGVWNYGGWVAE